MIMDIDQNFVELKNLIDQARSRAFQVVNTELVTLYWKIGKAISAQLESATWGEKTIDKLSEYLISHGPDYRGFNRRNLYRMKQFHDAYADEQFVSAVLTQIHWTHHMVILSKTKLVKSIKFRLACTITLLISCFFIVNYDVLLLSN
jgi:predicted nuclease of restriction endonuclease-like (RecB) superfamily